MNWNRWDLAYVARLAGVAIVLLGIGVAAWAALDSARGIGGGDRGQIFMEESLRFLFWGTIVALVAEIANVSLPKTGGRAGTSHGTEVIATLGRISGTIVLVGGVALATWYASEDGNFSLGTLVLQGLGDTSASAHVRVLIRQALVYVFYAFLIIALAEVCARIGWNGDAGEEATPADESEATTAG